MSSLRKNTIIVDFGVLPKRPDASQVQKFLEKEIQLQLSDTTNIQLHNIRNCVFIEMINAETAQRYQNLHNNKHIVNCDNKGFKIPVYVEKETITVRIHDLPPQMPHVTVLEFIQQYGTPISITREKWKYFFPGVYNGVRVLQMKLDRPIPSFITINGESSLVTYRNQPKTCRHCGRAAHPKQKCAKESVAATNDQPPETSNNTTQPMSVEEQSNTTNSNIEQQNNNTEINTITNDNASTSTTDSCTSAFTEAIVNQKRRLSGKKENESKKTCLSQQGSQNVSQSSNRFEALVSLDWMTPAELIRKHNKSGKGGSKMNWNVIT